MAVRFGFIGFGIMGQRLLNAAHGHDRSVLEVSGIFDPDPAAAKVLHGIDPELPVFESSAALIEASDCLHIASPPLSHLDYLVSCEAAGRATLCEKPLATDVHSAEATVALLESRGIRAGVNFPMASSFAVDYLSQWMTDGFVGTPERVDIELKFPSWPRAWQMDAIGWLDRRPEGGFTREVGSHFLFLSRRLCGALKLRSSSCEFPDDVRTEHAIVAELSAGDLPVSMTGAVGTTEKPDHNIWMLTGSKGRIRLRDWSIAEQEIDGKWVTPADALANEQARPLILERQLNKVAAMTNGESTTLATLREALDVMRIVEHIVRS